MMILLVIGGVVLVIGIVLAGDRRNAKFAGGLTVIGLLLVGVAGLVILGESLRYDREIALADRSVIRFEKAVEADPHDAWAKGRLADANRRLNEAIAEAEKAGYR